MDNTSMSLRALKGIASLRLTWRWAVLALLPLAL
ncbi:MAG: hypothetical protein HW397_198, partial [Dehalococcoidia bacterium]|nr:hypothetical protein [Dehalococcoidia bacterium]